MPTRKTVVFTSAEGMSEGRARKGSSGGSEIFIFWMAVEAFWVSSEAFRFFFVVAFFTFYFSSLTAFLNTLTLCLWITHFSSFIVRRLIFILIIEHKHNAPVPSCIKFVDDPVYIHVYISVDTHQCKTSQTFLRHGVSKIRFQSPKGTKWPFSRCCWHWHLLTEPWRWHTNLDGAGNWCIHGLAQLVCTQTSIGNFVAPYVKFCIDCIYINERRILGYDVFPHNWSEVNNFEIC